LNERIGGNAVSQSGVSDRIPSMHRRTGPTKNLEAVSATATGCAVRTSQRLKDALLVTLTEDTHQLDSLESLRGSLGRL
jgi:hypothetical protein